MEVKAPTWDAEIAPFLLLRLGFDLVVRRRHGGRRPSLRPLFTAHGLALRGRRTLVALPGPLLLAPLLVPFVVVHRDDLHRDVDGARLPVDGGGLRLRGNRFELVVRDVPEDALPALREALETLVARGAPNAFGAQRFGRDGDNVAKARAWLVEGGRPPRGRFEKRLYVSALQSDAFNRALAERLEEGSFDRPIDGDLFRKEDTGGLFVSDDLARATERCAAWEISPTGPMFGRKMRAPEGEAGAREARLREADAQREGRLRRAHRMPVAAGEEEERARPEGPGLGAGPEGSVPARPLAGAPPLRRASAWG